MSKELTPLEKMQLLIPGYRGYKVKDLIRQDDMLVRNYVRQNLENAINKLSDRESLIAQQDPFSSIIKQIEILNSKLRSLIADMATMQSGGTDVYARYKITSEALEQIVQNDSSLIDISNYLSQSALDGDINGINELIEKIRSILITRQRLFFPFLQ